MTEHAFKLRSRSTDGHVELSVFVGPDRDHYALAGTLRFRPDEYVDFIVRVLHAQGVLALDEIEGVSPKVRTWERNV